MSDTRLSLYSKNSERAEEMKSSFISLFIVGFIGLILDALVFIGIIDLKMTVIWKNICCSVMGIMFIALIFLAIVSIKSYKKLSGAAEIEDKLTEEITKWYKEALTPDRINEVIRNHPDYSSETDENELYFARLSLIYSALNSKFMNLDKKYAEHMAEVIYQDFFEE